MPLRPMANVLAVREADPERLRALEERVAARPQVTEIWKPAPGWVVGVMPLPEGVPDGEEVRAAGLVFTEGRELALPGTRDRSPAPDHREALGEIAELASRSPDRLARIPGDVGFLHLDGDGSLTGVRSCGGLVPIYSWQSDGRAIVTTRLTDLVALLDETPELDLLTNAIWLTGWPLFPDGRTFFRGIASLPRGSFLRIEPDRSRTGRYWDPRPDRLERPTPERTREHADRLRELLLATLERDLDPEGRNLLTLSGGVDSSSLAALATGTVGRRISTLSFVPEGGEALERTRFYLDNILTHARPERHWEYPLTLPVRIELMRQAPAVAFCVRHPALGALPAITAEAPIRVLFGGEFADEVCGSRFTMPDWIQHTTPLDLLRGPLPSGPRDILRWGRWRLRAISGRPRSLWRRDLPELIRAEVRDEYRAWLSRRRRTLIEDPRPSAYVAQRAEADAFVNMNWEASSTLQVRRSFPFFTREILDLAFECHPRELIGEQPVKGMLRRAVAGHVPDANLYRPDTGTWQGHGRADPPSTLRSEARRLVADADGAAPAPQLSAVDLLTLWGLEQLLASVDEVRNQVTDTPAAPSG